MAERAILVNAEKVVHETIDGEVIIIDLESGTYYNLVGVGADLWAGVVQNASRRQLAAALAARYSAEPEQVAAAVDSLVDEMLAEQIVVEAPGDLPAAFALDGASGLSFVPPKLEKYTNMSDLLLLDPIHDVDEQGWPHRK